MAYWDNVTQSIRYSEPVPYPNYPGWVLKDCGCCNGLVWGGWEPLECGNCNGSGRYAEHIQSGVTALYPGGPFC